MSDFVLMGEGMLERLHNEMGEDFFGSWNDEADYWNEDESCEISEKNKVEIAIDPCGA